MDSEIIGRRRFPASAGVWLALAAASYGVGHVAQGPTCGLLAATPTAMLALGCLTARPTPARGRLTAAGLDMTSPRISAPYAAITCLRLVGSRQKDRRYSELQIGVPDQLIRVRVPSSPALLTLCELLLARVGFSGGRNVTPALRPTLEYLEGKFGADRVFTFVARLVDLPPYRVLRHCGLFMMLAAALWIAAGARRDFSQFVCPGWALLIVGVTAAAISLLRAGVVPARLLDASVIISPAGVTLAQGDVVGELKWAELQRISFGRGQSRSFQLDKDQALRLHVEGTAIMILDVYDRPLECLKRLIDLYWQGSAACPGCRRQLTPAQGPLCPHCALP